ncbi:MAG: translation initiation factor IF-2 N-terminal domain-containing protein [Phycisphaerales bacterium]
MDGPSSSHGRRRTHADDAAAETHLEQQDNANADVTNERPEASPHGDAPDLDDGGHERGHEVDFDAHERELGGEFAPSSSDREGDLVSDDDAGADEAPSTEPDTGDEATAPSVEGDDLDIVEVDSDSTETRSRDRRGRHSRGERERERKAERRTPVPQLMLVNDVPGEECRIAVLEHGRIEALFMEREGTATNVGNIYKGRVTNVEPAIQAAFIDYGEGASGFLHISDLHPKYFPGEERTERVGRKIPRRERPLIQEALRKGQEVVVQVLKEGLGSKGPTLTSYLSIPGRLMVMMPDMDRVGVSRKVEDEDQRRAMRKILDQLELPEGFGFILRTAGFDRTKTELSRDLAYLKRLWEVMQRRSASSGAPCMLYSEGDLLIRTLRDMADEHVEAIIVDSEEAFRKATAFLDIVSPRTAPKVRYWEKSRNGGEGRAPLFHAFDVERQISMLHSREVPLPSGGALVIDQAEALVAIDVNSGRSRSARDSETNAYHTNIEAVDEIARQLRLRDLGGVIINDLIDMRAPKHRRDIEDRFREALRRDRAKSTLLPISEFGVIEMTRQRMRPSVRKTHFMDCPHCHGLGEVMMPETVAADHLREVEFLCGFGKIRRVEVVCSTRVASVLLSSKRRSLYELEERTGRRIDVRISEAIPLDRMDIYAYDDRGADVEIARLPRPQRPEVTAIPTALPDRPDADDFDDVETEPEPGRRGRRRRRRKPGPADTTAMILGGSFADLPSAAPDENEPTIAEAIAAERAAARQQSQRPPAEPAEPRAAGEQEDGDRRRRRRRRRGGRGRDGAAQQVPVAGGVAPVVEADAQPPEPPPPPPPSEPALVHILAKELGVGSKELLAKCHEGGLEVKSHMSKLTGEQVDLVKNWYRPPAPPPPPPAPALVIDDADDADDSDGGTDERGDGAAGHGDDRDGQGGRRRRRRRRRRGGGSGQQRDGAAPGAPQQSQGPRTGEQPPAQRQHGGRGQQQHGHGQRDGQREEQRDGDRPGGEGGKRKRRRRRRGRGSAEAEQRPQQSAGGERRDSDRPASPPSSAPNPPPASAPQASQRRSLYGGRFRKLSGGAEGGGDDE